MRKKRTMNQLALTPMRMPKMQASWMFPRGPMSSMLGRDRALIAELQLWATAVDDRREVDAGRQRAVLEAPIARQARRAEGVGDGGGRVAHEQRALQAQRHAFDDAPRARLERAGIGELSLQL